MKRSFKQFKKGLASRKYCSTVISICPELAKEMRKHNTQNRQYRDTRSKVMAEDMTSNRWSKTGESISFRSDGVMLTGQHRVEAIIMSGTTQPTVVVFNTDKDAPMYEGMGIRFTPNDHLARNGYKHLAIGWNGGAVLKHMRYAFDQPRAGMKAPEVVAMAKKYEKEVFFAHKCFENIKGGKIAIAPVLGVIARAIYCMPGKRSDIVRFCEILKNGMLPKVNGKTPPPEERDRVAVVMRDSLLSQRNHKGADICNTCRKMETALYRFIKNRDIEKNLSGTREELFPIPEDESVTTTASNPNYFCVPSKSLRCPVLSVPEIKKMISKQCVPLKSKKMVGAMRPNDKVCVLGFNSKGYMARLAGSIKKVNVKGKNVSILLKDGKMVNGPLVSSIWSSLNSLKKSKMPIKVFASSVRALDERDFARLTK